MKETQKKLILIDCKIMLKKFGDLPFATLHETGQLQAELWSIGNKYGLSGIEVLRILIENFPREESV